MPLLKSQLVKVQESTIKMLLYLYGYIPKELVDRFNMVTWLLAANFIGYPVSLVKNYVLFIPLRRVAATQHISCIEATCKTIKTEIRLTLAVHWTLKGMFVRPSLTFYSLFPITSCIAFM